MVILTFYMIFSTITGQDINGSFGAGVAMLDIVNMLTFIFVYHMIIQKKTDCKVSVLATMGSFKNKPKDVT